MKKILIFTVLLVCIVTFGVIAYAQEQWSNPGFEQEYEIGTVVSIPQVTLGIGGEKATADAVVYCPDGQVTTEKKITLDVAGQYTVEYTAVISGNYYVKEYQFLVYNPLVSFSSENTSVSYGTYALDEDVEGLMVSLAQGDRLTINQPIDVASLSKIDLLLQAIATPKVDGQADFNRLCFQLTDVHNPEITLYFAGYGYPNQRFKSTYVVAGGNGQKPKGYEKASGKVHEEKTWGCPDTHSFFTAKDNNPMSFYIDNSTMEVFHGKNFIIDLDNPSYFDTMWTGFPSGKAYLTVWADDYYADSANFCLTAVGKIDLSAQKVIDSEGPVITIDNAYQTMPNAVKDGTYQYIPSATALDVFSGVCDVTTTVWYNYNSSNPAIVEQVDGKFMTSRIGNYAIVYEATDAAGNVGREIIWVKSVSQINKPEISLNEAALQAYTVGDCFMPQQYTANSYSGEPAVSIFIQQSDKRIPLNSDYRFEKEGKHSVIYEVCDAAGQTSQYQFEITVTMGKTPVLVDKVVLDEYLVEDVKYIFPQVYFNDYRTGEIVKKLATGKIVDAAGTRTLKAGDTFSVKVANNLDKVSITFECEGATYNMELPVVKAWVEEDGRAKLQIQNYFIANGINLQKDVSGTVVTAETSNAGWLFANPQISEDMSVVLQGIPTQSNFEALQVTLRDYENADKKLVVELRNTKSYLTVCADGRTTLLKEGTDFRSAGMIDIRLSGNELYVCGVLVNTDVIETFSDHKVYISVDFVNASNGAAYRLQSINGHVMNATNSDRTGPKISVTGHYGGLAPYGTQMLLPAAFAGDVLCPNTTFSMKVVSGDKVVSDINGTVLDGVDPTKDYYINIEQYGTYEVVYTAQEEFSARPVNFSYVLQVIDMIAPEIKFSHAYETEAKVGDVLCIPNFTVADNITATENIALLRYVIDPSGTMLTLPASSNSVKASVAGEYTFLVMALDESGNICSEKWTVTVTTE